jgi:arabinan endo-1,5-alpha-L-arabinosidase
MRTVARHIVSLLVASAAMLAAAGPKLLPLDGDLAVHDPAIIKDADTYYVFCTGGGRGGVIPIRTSKDLRHWDLAGYVFAKLPDWVKTEVPKANGAWAPDISFYDGEYHLYYAVSSFGVNESAIGLATTPTLDAKSPKYAWTDRGMVVRSHTADDYNTIDPNLVVENEKSVWLNWGSFWGGIKMRRLDPATGLLSSKDTTLYSLASRPRGKPKETPPQDGAIEAPFIFRHGGYWYLFASFDFCCRGAKSDYNVVVGRSRKVTGPYVDKAGKPMTEGGGTTIVPPISPLWHGAGHEAVLHDGQTDYLLFHAYDPKTGRSFMEISTIAWNGGWPEVASQ